MSWFVLDQINWEVLSPSHASHPIQIEFERTIAYLESQVIIVVTYPEDIYFLPIFQHQLRVWNPWATVVQIIGFVWQVARLLIYPQLIFLFAISSLTINQLASLKLQVAGLNSILLRSIKRPLNDKTNYFFFFFMHCIGDGCDNTRRSTWGVLWSKIDWITEVAMITLDWLSWWTKFCLSNSSGCLLW